MKNWKSWDTNSMLRSTSWPQPNTRRSDCRASWNDWPEAREPIGFALVRNVGDLFKRVDRPDRWGCDDLHLPERSGSKEAEFADWEPERKAGRRGGRKPLTETRAQLYSTKDGDCILPKAYCMELDDFRKSNLLHSSRGSYTSPALALPATPVWICCRGTIVSNHSSTTSEHPPATVLKSIGLFCIIERRFNQRYQYHIWKFASSSGVRAALLLPELPTKLEKNCSPSTTRNPKITEENSRKSFTQKLCFRQMPRWNTLTR